MKEHPLGVDTHGRQDAGWVSQFLEEYERDPEFVAESLALDITEQARRIMRDKGISRTELASLMGVSKAYVSRVLNAPSNLTLRSIAQLALALGVKPQAGLVTEEPAATNRESAPAQEAHPQPEAKVKRKVRRAS